MRLKQLLGLGNPKTINRELHRGAVGGLWDEIGKLQFDFLVDHGLKPNSCLLDVGCGCLRGGIHFVNYLERGRYFGVDKSKELLNAGVEELKEHRLEYKVPVLVAMEEFDFERLNQRFDYAIAQSVFTHLPFNSIVRCLMNIEKVLQPGGRFYCTFFENIQGKFNLDPILHSRVDGSDFPTFFDRDPYHYDVETFQFICEQTNLRAKYIGPWNHPRDQRMVVFTKTEDRT